jgi:hypothetical protein
VVSCGVRSSEVGLAEIRKPQVSFYLGSIGPFLSFGAKLVPKHQDPP